MLNIAQTIRRAIGILTCCIVVLVMLLCASAAQAQSFYGSVVGSVTDAGGAVIQHAKVSLINQSTNEGKTLFSDDQGNYRFVNLLPASYKVVVEKDKFKRFVRTAVEVQVDSTSRVDVAMEVGAIDETVTVTTEAPLMQTDSGTLGAEVEGKTVQQMPLNGRNAMNLVSLVPGVTGAGASSGATEGNQGTHTSNQGWGNYSIGGGLGNQGAMYVDGTPINTLGGNFAGFVPTQDMVQEFKVATNSVSAEFGRFNGGVIEMTTKSGQNQIHGTAYEFVRNKIFNSNNYFTKMEGGDREKWNQNQYGVVAGGPIKKDKAFAMFSWESFVSRLGSLAEVYVPSSDMQNGVFVGKHLTDSTGNCAITYDSASNTSTIPQSCWDSTSAVMKKYYPTPNHADTGTYNYASSVVTGSDSSQYNGRVDYTLSEKQRLFARYTYMKINDIGSDTFHSANGFKTAGSHGDQSAIQGVIGDTYTINPTTIADFRASFLRIYIDNMPPSLGQDETTFGSNWGNLESQMSYKALPLPYIAGNYSLQKFNSSDVLSFNWYDNYTLSGNITKMLPAHTLKLGAEVRLMDNVGTATMSNSSGYFEFKNTMYTGDEWANFLLGYANDGSASTGLMSAAYNYYQGYYLTDVWQVGHKLTVNLGIRWELPGALAERKDRAVVALPTKTDALTGALGTLALVNSSDWKSRYLEEPKHNLFSPRLGFAYRIDESSVIRGGFGLTYSAPDLQSTMLPVTAPINSATTSWNNTAAATYRLSNPFPSGIIQSKGRANTSFMESLLGQAISGPVPTTKYPYSESWNLSASHQFKGNMMAEVGYAGALGIHLPEYGWNINQLGDANFATLKAQWEAAGSPSTLPDSIHTYGQSLRPLPAYLNFVDTAAFVGTSNYQSLQARAEKRFGAAGMIGAAYTWSKLLGTADTVNPFLEGQYGVGAIQDYNNLKNERSLISSAIPQRLVINYMLNLPFGKGQRYGANLNSVAKAAISGWAVNGITTFQSGIFFPIQMNGNFLTQYFGGGTLRPNYVSGCKKTISGSYASRLNEWFNTACFTSPGEFAFGNQPRVDTKLQGEGTDNWDMAIQKMTDTTHNTSLQFRFEFFNIFNRTVFGLPGLAVDGGNFGKVTGSSGERKGQASLRLFF